MGMGMECTRRGAVGRIHLSSDPTMADRAHVAVLISSKGRLIHQCRTDI
jgi:hypothetical protein